jgi:hypothetical protein
VLYAFENLPFIKYQSYLLVLCGFKKNNNLNNIVNMPDITLQWGTCIVGCITNFVRVIITHYYFCNKLGVVKHGIF